MVAARIFNIRSYSMVLDKQERREMITRKILGDSCPSEKIPTELQWKVQAATESGKFAKKKNSFGCYL